LRRVERELEVDRVDAVGDLQHELRSSVAATSRRVLDVDADERVAVEAWSVEARVLVDARNQGATTCELQQVRHRPSLVVVEVCDIARRRRRPVSLRSWTAGPELLCRLSYRSTKSSGRDSNPRPVDEES